MSSNISAKPAASAPQMSSAHPFEAGVRQDIAALRSQLTQLKNSGPLDALGRTQVKNLEAQLGKKNAYLASITPNVEKTVAAPAPKKPVDVAAPALRPATPAKRSALAAPQESFGALGARLKGRLAPELGLQLAPNAPPEMEGF